MNPQPSPQIAPATVLAQLLTEHPDLPRLFWTISPDGWLSGSLYRDDVDARAAMARLVAVLGGTPDELRRDAEADETGTERFSTVLGATWRGVSFYLSMGCDATAVDLPAVAS